MTTTPRVIVSRPAGPDGPAVLAVWDAGPAPVVVVPLPPAVVLRLARDLLAVLDVVATGPERPAHAHLAGAHREATEERNANPEPPQGESRAFGGVNV